MTGALQNLCMDGGEGEIRTHATVARPNAFRVRPLITTWVLLHKFMERVRGIEPPPSAWEAEILPLNHTRIIKDDYYYNIISRDVKKKIHVLEKRAETSALHDASSFGGGLTANNVAMAARIDKPLNKIKIQWVEYFINNAIIGGPAATPIKRIEL